MLDEEAAGPSYAQLKALTSTPRVYEDLESRLVEVETHPDNEVAHLLGVCAGYAYGTSEDVSTMMTRMGLPENSCRMTGVYIHPMFISSTAFVIQSSDGRVVILAYRGTEPVNLISWLTDFDVNPTEIEIPFEALRKRLDEPVEEFYVHGGFYRNVRATWDTIIELLELARAGSPISKEKGREGGALHPMEALYVTGHSLGGAMATLTTLFLLKESRFAGIAETLRATYTFGAPMVGNPPLAAACDLDPDIRGKLVRYVYREDVVPHLPPRDTGEFKHFGREFRYDGGDWGESRRATSQMGFAGHIAEAPLSFVLGQFPLLRRVPFRYKLDDHLPHRYIAALTPKDKPSEFGDYRLRTD